MKFTYREIFQKSEKNLQEFSTKNASLGGLKAIFG
jgi:hypothetical protein